MIVKDLDALLRADLVTRTGGTLGDASRAILVGPDEDGYWYLAPPGKDGDSYAWSQTPTEADSVVVAS